MNQLDIILTLCSELYKRGYYNAHFDVKFKGISDISYVESEYISRISYFTFLMEGMYLTKYNKSIFGDNIYFRKKPPQKFDYLPEDSICYEVNAPESIILFNKLNMMNGGKIIRCTEAYLSCSNIDESIKEVIYFIVDKFGYIETWKLQKKVDLLLLQHSDYNKQSQKEIIKAIFNKFVKEDEICLQPKRNF